MKTASKIRGAFVAMLLVSIWAIIGAKPVWAQTQPALVSQTLFGGSGDQFGSGIALDGSSLYVSGFSPVGVGTGLLRKYRVAPLTPLWSAILPDTFPIFGGLEVTANTIYVAGSAFPTACGALDGFGGTEHKSMLARYTTDGVLLGCNSHNYFDNYRGIERHVDVTSGTVGTDTFIYTTGSAEPCGFTNHGVLAKYTTAGALLITRPDNSSCNANVDAFISDVTFFNGHVYRASAAVDGEGQLPGGINRPVLWKYDANLNLVWRRRVTSLQGFFLGVSAIGGHIYAVGFSSGSGVPGLVDYVIQKYDENGNLIWSRTHGGAGQDILSTIVGIGGFLYAVGSTSSQGNGGFDVAILKLDPANGDLVSITTFGGSQDDVAHSIFGEVGQGGAATDGTNLFVVGSSKSFTTAEGNQAGQWDVLLLHYSVGVVGNTPTGANVSVQPRDSTTGTSPVTLTFSNVSQTGTTNLTTSSTGPPPPSGFKLGSPPTYYEITTTALFSGPVKVCINYTGITFGNESALKLFRREDNAWVDRTISLETTNKIICAGVTSLSTFAIFEPVDIIPRLSVEPSSVTFEARPGAGNPAPQTLGISNGGGGTLQWRAQAQSSGGNWLVVAPSSGTASVGSPAAVQVIANVAGLAAGVYSGSVRVESPTTGEKQTVAVTLLLSQVTKTILVSQSGFLFTGVEGAGVVPSQTFGILNTGQGAMSWMVRVETLSGGGWLSVSPSSGESLAESLEIPQVEVKVNLGTLRAGQYSGLLRVEAAGANNTPQFVTVELTVLPPGSNPGALVRPTGLIFAARAGTSSPGSQTVRLSKAAPGAVEAVAGLVTLKGGDWLQAVPTNLVVSPAEPRTIAVQPRLGSLAPDVYRAATTLVFGDGSPAQTVNILFLVVGAAGAGGSQAASEPQTSADSFDAQAAQQCVAQRLHAVHRTLGSNFASPVGWPSPIEVQVLDDCGSAVGNAAVVASFTNGDPPLTLASLRNGLYVGTWRPAREAAQVTVTVRAALPPLAEAVVQAHGQVRTNPAAPAVNAGGIVNGASFTAGEALTPGSIVSVFGRNLARGVNTATRVPLPFSLGGTTLNVGGVDAPLFFAGEGQINAQIPFEVAPNSRPHVVARVRGDGSGPEAVTVPETITIAEARPAIFTMNQQGTGQGAIVDAQGRVVDSSVPASMGQVVQVFCTGLGITAPRVGSGQPAPDTEPLARVVMAVEATVGGRTARVLFAGLAPRFVGLYQVNVEIPAGLTAGPEVPLVLIQNGVPSNTVTLAIR